MAGNTVRDSSGHYVSRGYLTRFPLFDQCVRAGKVGDQPSRNRILPRGETPLHDGGELRLCQSADLASLAIDGRHSDEGSVDTMKAAGDDTLLFQHVL